MKAIIQNRYGPPDVLELKDVERPAPKDDEVLVKIEAACINWANKALVRGKPLVLRMGYGLTRPKFRIPGR